MTLICRVSFTASLSKALDSKRYSEQREKNVFLVCFCSGWFLWFIPCWYGVIELFGYRVINICCSQQNTKYIVSFSISFSVLLPDLAKSHWIFVWIKIPLIPEMGRWAIKMCESKQRKGRGRGSAIDWVKGSEGLSWGERSNKNKAAKDSD